MDIFKEVSVETLSINPSVHENYKTKDYHKMCTGEIEKVLPR